jgi:hypothetical protein
MTTAYPPRSAKAFLLFGFMCIFFFISSSGCQKTADLEKKDTNDKTKENSQMALVMPSNAAYTGAYVDFGEGESHVTFEALTGFEQMTGKHLAVIAMGNFWGERAFPAKTVGIISGYGAIPLIFWSPWDKPYKETVGPDRFNLPDILAGKWDQYIDQWADAARNYGKPLLVTWGLEMNGTWFPWSGYYYGGGKVIGKKDGQPLYAGPETVKKAYRYVVDRVRARKADNILWGFHVNNFASPRDSWNRMINYYPGARYVDWLGLSVYGKMAKSEGWPTFSNMMDGPYKEICQLDPQKPIILAEWGVGEFPPGDKAGFIAAAFTDLQTKYQRIRAAIYWHERWENEDGSYSNLRVNSSPEALQAYQAGVASPYWIDRPKFEPKPKVK